MKKTHKKYILYFFVLLIFVSLLGMFDFYFFGNKIFLGKFTSKFISYPVMLVNGDFVNYKEYKKFVNDFDTYFPNLEKNDIIISKMIIQDKILEEQIKNLKIIIRDKDFRIFANDFYEINNIASKEMNYLKDNYNWDKNLFEYYVIRPLYLENLIAGVIKSDEFNIENKIKIESVYEDISKNPNKFEEYATIYKDDTLFNEIGWMTYKDLPSNLSGKVDKLEVGNFTTVLKSISGYHIYKLKGKIKAEDSEEYYYKFTQIFLPIKSISSYLDDTLKKSKIHYFLKFDNK
ncbi:MAG: peptidylprolyl isomerase [Patescibacteria group bacterium]|nr:peptidylprolyl isomerase [Patescibacteria group bacterium]MDD4304431.1 peptidylprolyl isomerase [Patescibacteria group bacterium]MDD4695454.1 peptidylprolyl isomerase [Patescibacteria group bacterium]